MGVPKAYGERRGGLLWPATNLPHNTWVRFHFPRDLAPDTEPRVDGYSVPATGVQNSSHLGVSVTFTMPFTFSFEEYADMIYVYGFCDGKSVLAVAEYQQRFPNRRIPNRRVFTGSLPDIARYR